MAPGLDQRMNVPQGYAQLETTFTDEPVNGTVRLTGVASATPGWEVVEVLLWLDDQLIGRAYPRSSGEWSFALDTTKLVDGSHELRLCGMAAPEGAPALFTFNGDGDTVTFETENGNNPVTLYERHVRLGPATTETWTWTVDAPYSGLRVKVEAVDDAPAPTGAFVQAAVTYHAPPSVAVGSGGEDVTVTPPKTWIVTYGADERSFSLGDRGDAGLAPGGLLTLDGVYAGQSGEVTVTVEALPDW